MATQLHAMIERSKEQCRCKPLTLLDTPLRENTSFKLIYYNFKTIMDNVPLLSNIQIQSYEKVEDQCQATKIAYFDGH